MNAKSFVETVLKGLWPEWSETDEEARMWIEILVPYDYEKARLAVKSWFLEQDKVYKRPPAGKIRKLLSQTLPISRPRREPKLQFTLKPILENGLFGKGTGFYANSAPNRAADEIIAQKAAQRAEQLYGRKYAIFWPSIIGPET